jgi:hypothetical protein
MGAIGIQKAELPYEKMVLKERTDSLQNFNRESRSFHQMKAASFYLRSRRPKPPLPLMAASIIRVCEPGNRRSTAPLQNRRDFLPARLG